LIYIYFTQYFSVSRHAKLFGLSNADFYPADKLQVMHSSDTKKQ